MKAGLQKHILQDYLEFASSSWGEHTAVVANGRPFTYLELRDRVLRLAAYLTGQGVTRGDRVLILLPNSIEYVTCFWAVQYIGGVAVPVSVETKVAKLRSIMLDSTPTAVILDASIEDRFEELHLERLPSNILWNGYPRQNSGVEISAILEAVEPATITFPPRVIDQDIASIIYTSGSTGTPKGVMLSHLNMIAASTSVSSYLGLNTADRIFCAIPFTFDYGLYQILLATLVGAALIIEPSFAQPLFALNRLVQQEATVFPLVPTMVGLIEPLAARFDFGKVRIVTSTAANLNPVSVDKVRHIFKEAKIFSMYGLTECHRCTYLEPSELERRKTSVGKAIPNTELWVVDADGQRHDRDAIGELVIRGSTVMQGYWNNPLQTNVKLKDGTMPGERVLYTGDVCRIDEEGFVYFICRTDEILKVKGEKVAPKEVEDVLVQHPDVAEAAVVGMPHYLKGDEVVAFVVMREPADSTCSVLRKWCAEHLEPHMVPSQIYSVEMLDKNVNGKVDKAALKEHLDSTVRNKRTAPRMTKP